MSSAKKHGGKNKGLWTARPLRILVDMDGVLCDLEGHFLKMWREKYPDLPFIPLEERRTFYIADQYKHFGEGFEKKARGIILEKGFYRNLPVIECSVDAVKEMSGLDNVEVFICTSQMSNSPSSATEKLEWIEQHFGLSWVKRVIMLNDKTLVLGDILFDDRSSFKGLVDPPSWQHILFTCCHNAHLDLSRLKCQARLDSWADKDAWMNIIENAKKNLS